MMINIPQEQPFHLHNQLAETMRALDHAQVMYRLWTKVADTEPNPASLQEYRGEADFFGSWVLRLERRRDEVLAEIAIDRRAPRYLS